MTKVGVAKLKASLSEYLRKVQQGSDVVVYDRDTPIARIVPFERANLVGGLVVRPAKPGLRLQDVPIPPPLELAPGFDIVELLLEDRRQDRERLP